jgi:hypothetical protein
MRNADQNFSQPNVLGLPLLAPMPQGIDMQGGHLERQIAHEQLI